MKAISGSKNERKDLVDSLFARIRCLRRDLRSESKINDGEENWFEQRMILTVKRAVDKYVLVESRVRTRHLLFSIYDLTVEAQTNAFYISAKIAHYRRD